MENFASDFGEEEDRRRWAAVAAKTQWSFNRLFWNESAGCLYDVVNGGAPDNSMRPNQIIAAGIHHSMLSHERTRAVVEAVERELLTPVGLRSLNTSDSRYKGRYEGSPYDRDSVYHQGTVWPWLLGPFVSAYVRVNGDAGRERASELLRGLERHLYEAGLGQISEIFDADPPHRARGCFAQAWSVAEVLRVLVEDVHQVSAKRRAAGAA
jgi:glycogen debranching enzyme